MAPKRMTSKFVSARELKKCYSVMGHFYDISLDGAVHLNCRSSLEILSLVNADDFRDVCRGLPDAVFIMMNPGSSRPLDKLPSSIRDIRAISDRKTFVKTRPDTTQYQVMRVMARLGWQHVRVLNLSDLREPKSSVFSSRFQSIEASHGYTAHSLFSPIRTPELTRELHRKVDAPLICAWGVSPKLNSLICVAAPVLRDAGICRGLLKVGTSDRYFHPLPTLQTDKEIWVNKLCKELGRDV